MAKRGKGTGERVEGRAMNQHILVLTAWAMVAALGALAAEGNGKPPSEAPTVTWNPLAEPVREADTIFLADFSSWQTIDRAGGFLFGHHNETSEQVKDKYEFGAGKFGPAVKAKPGDDWTFIVYPQDGLIPADEFTIEFSAKAEGGWARDPGRAIFLVQGEANRLSLRTDKQSLEVGFGGPGYWKNQKRSHSECGLNGGEAWHAFAFTIKDGTFRLYVDGKETVKFEKVPPLAPWSDAGWGICLGGEPHGAANVWVSDFRISRTARLPGQPVTLRGLAGTVTVDAAKKTGAVPPLLLGALHPGGAPAQTKAALHVIRTDKILNATPMKAGAPDAEHPAAGKSGRFSYDWQVCDRVFDWMQEHGVAPYISIDATPSILGGGVKPFAGEQLHSALSSSSGFGPKPPNDFDDWAAVVKDFVHHVLNEKKAVVPRWGVWNEPDFDAFWNAGVDKYLDLYAATVKAVREVDRNARIGGPEVAGFHEKWIKPLFERCAKEKLPLDFISYHDYSGELNSPAHARAKVDEWAAAAGFKTPFPIVVGEFNWSGQNLYKTGVSRLNSGMWHIRAFGAAYTTAFLTRLVELPAFELFIYSHTAYGNPRDGGWASTQLIGRKGEQWAPYNALKGWKAVVGTEVLEARKDLPPGAYALATADAAGGRVGLVLVNYGFAQREARTVQVSLQGLKAGAWRMARYVVDPKNSSRWDVAEDRPEGQAENELKKVEEKALQAAPGQPLPLSLELPAWSSTFVALEAGN